MPPEVVVSIDSVNDRNPSCAGLVPVTALAEQTQLMDLLAEKVIIKTSKITSVTYKGLKFVPNRVMPLLA